LAAQLRSLIEMAERLAERDQRERPDDTEVIGSRLQAVAYARDALRSLLSIDGRRPGPTQSVPSW